MKKAFVGFPFQIRPVKTERDFFRLCENFLDYDEPMLREPISLALKEPD